MGFGAVIRLVSIRDLRLGVFYGLFCRLVFGLFALRNVVLNTITPVRRFLHAV